MKLFLFALIVALIASPVIAHDYEHPELAEWYRSLKSQGGACCDGTDATHIADVDWDTTCEKNNFGETRCNYRVRLYDKWWDVPAQAVLDGPNRDGSALVWAVPTYNGEKVFSVYIRCFMPGSGT